MDNLFKFKPQIKKPMSPYNLALFSQKAEKLPKDNRQQKRDKFRLIMKNKMSQKTK